MSSANIQLRHAMRRLLVLQLVSTAIVALVGLVWQGSIAVRPALFGGATAMVGTLVIAWYGRRAERAGASVARNASLIYGSAIVRFSTVMVLLFVGIAILRLQPVWLFAGFIATLLAQMILTALVPEKKTWRAKR